MNEFLFKEIDQKGMDTLNVISQADRFNEWMYETIVPHTKNPILEIGSGIGNISALFFKNGASLCLSDVRSSYCEYLKIKFAQQEGLLGILHMDIVDKNFDEKFSHLFKSFESIFALNVIEHIEDDDLAIKNCKKLLRAGGQLTILVPAYQWLYNEFDKQLEHYRRYTKKGLKELVGRHLKITHSQYFNFIGVFGWFLSGRVLRKKIIPSSQMKLYNKWVPVIRIADAILFNQIGLSTIVVGQKVDGEPFMKD
jgi:SAM-dependent methyltransferase